MTQGRRIKAFRGVARPGLHPKLLWPGRNVSAAPPAPVQKWGCSHCGHEEHPDRVCGAWVDFGVECTCLVSADGLHINPQNVCDT